MRALRKTGVRAPFQPGPILEAGAPPPSEMLRPVVVIGAIVPALLLGGAARPIGIPARDANVDPRRPTVVIQGQMPVPGASVWLGTPAHETPGAQPDRAQQEAAQIIRGQQPIPGALAQFVSRVAIVEDVQWPARPAVVRQGQQPIPGAATYQLTGPRDQVAAAPDRVPIVRVLSGQQPIPTSGTAWVGIAHDGDRLRAMGPQTLSGQQPRPEAQTLRVGRTTQTPTDRIRANGPLTCGPPVPVPGAAVLRVGAAFEPPPPPAAVTRFVELTLAARPSYTITARGAFIIEEQPDLTIEGED